MATTYLRPLTKRVKLVSTCDVCKNRKVKCDKERPECGTCKKTNRKCSYTYAALTETMRDKRAQTDSSFIQTQLNYLQKMQFGQLYEESGYLSMASRGFGIDVNESQHIPGMLARPVMPMTTTENVYDSPDGTSILTSEVLHYSSNIASSIPRNTEQQLYDSSYYLSDNDFVALTQQVPVNLYQPQTSIPPQQFHQQLLPPQQSPHQQMPQQPPPHQSSHQPPQQQHSRAIVEDTVMEDLISNLKNISLYESSRYVGEGSLLMFGEENYGELIIPEMSNDISGVIDSLKILPNQESSVQLISLYYKHVHRYFPAIREQVVWNALGDLSKAQHLLLLNCIFFIASPFHNNPQQKDGKIYFDRAEALLYEYCTQPHALTVMAIILLGRHNKQMGSGWMYNGIATKMLFELGLHRKFSNLKFKMDKEIEKLRNEAFWMTFISENLISTTYGRPNMIDETDCDIDVPSIPSNSTGPTDEKTKLEIAYIYLINLSRICARVRKYMHAASRLRFLLQEDENKFRVLDAALASWFNSLPDWLKFEKIVKDPDGVLLNGVGGDIHIFFYTILILLHSRYMRPQASYQYDDSSTTSSSIICIQSAAIIVHWLEILLDKHPNFFNLSASGSLAINPAKSVFQWHINDESNKRKAQDMLQRLEVIRSRVIEISESHGERRSCEGRWLGIKTTPYTRAVNHEINAREWEVFISDDDKLIRKQYSMIARKQTGGHFMPRRQGSSYSRSMNTSSYMRGVKQHSSGSRYDFMGQQSMQTEDFNFTFKTDKTFDFSAFPSEQNFNLPQLTVDGVVFDEPEQLILQDNQQFDSQYHTPLQQSPQLQQQQFHSPLQQSPQLQPQQFHTPLSQSPQQQHSPQQIYNSSLEQSPQISQISHEEIDLKLPQIDTSLFTLLSNNQQYIDKNNIDFNNNNNNNILWTPPHSARPQRWNQSNIDDLSSNTLTTTSLSVENTMLTPPMQPQDLLDDIAGDWNGLQNDDNFGDDGHNNGLGISVMRNNNNQ